MNSPLQYRDRNSVLLIKFSGSISTSTLGRFMKRANDPFPPGKLIGRKRFWRDDVIDEWLERQGADQIPDETAPPEADAEPVPAAA